MSIINRTRVYFLQWLYAKAITPEPLIQPYFRLISITAATISCLLVMVFSKYQPAGVIIILCFQY